MVKVIGFRPEPEDMKRLADLQEIFKDGNALAKISNTDVLRLALKNLHEEYKGREI